GGVGARPTGGAWNARGQIIFGAWGAGFSVVNASNGVASKLTELAPGEIAHGWPQFLPDDDHFLFYVYGNAERGGTYVGRVTTGERTRLMATDAGAVYSPLGYLVFTLHGLLTAQRFDTRTFALSGEPFGITAGNVESPSMTNGTQLSAGGDLVAFGGA